MVTTASPRPRSRTASAASSRDSTSTVSPGFNPCRSTKLEERRILIGDPGDDDALAHRAAEERLELPFTERPLRPGNRVAVGIGLRVPEHLVHPLDEPVRHHVLEMLGVVVHLVPAHAHHLHQEQLDQPMAAQHRGRQLRRLPR